MKKITLALTSLASIAAPVAAVVSCGADAGAPGAINPATGKPQAKVITGNFKVDGKKYKTYQEAKTAALRGYIKHNSGYTFKNSDKIFENKEDIWNILKGHIKTGLFAWDSNNPKITGVGEKTSHDGKYKLPAQFTSMPYINFGTGGPVTGIQPYVLGVEDLTPGSSLTDFGGHQVFIHRIDKPDGSTERQAYKTEAAAAHQMATSVNKLELEYQQPKGWERLFKDPNTDFEHIFIPGTAHVYINQALMYPIDERGVSTALESFDLPASYTKTARSSDDLPSSDFILDHIKWIKKGVNGMPEMTEAMRQGYKAYKFKIPNVTRFSEVEGSSQHGAPITEDITYTVYKKGNEPLDIANDLEFKYSTSLETFGSLTVKSKYANDPSKWGDIQIAMTYTLPNGLSGISGTTDPTVKVRLDGINAWDKVKVKDFDANSLKTGMTVKNYNLSDLWRESRKASYQLVFRDDSKSFTHEFSNIWEQELYGADGSEPTSPPMDLKAYSKWLVDHNMHDFAKEGVQVNWTTHPFLGTTEREFLDNIQHYTTTAGWETYVVTDELFNNLRDGKEFDPYGPGIINDVSLNKVFTQDEINDAINRAKANPDVPSTAVYKAAQGFYLGDIDDAIMQEQTGIFASIEDMKNYFLGDEEGAIDYKNVIQRVPSSHGRPLSKEQIAYERGFLLKQVNHFEGAEWYTEAATGRQFKSKYELLDSRISVDGEAMHSYYYELFEKNDVLNYGIQDHSDSFNIKKEITDFLATVNNHDRGRTSNWEDGIDGSWAGRYGNGSPVRQVRETTDHTTFKIDGIDTIFTSDNQAEEALWSTKEAFRIHAGFIKQEDFDRHGLTPIPWTPNNRPEGPYKVGEDVPFMIRLRDPRLSVNGFTKDGEPIKEIDVVRQTMLDPEFRNVFIVKDANPRNWRVYKSEFAANAAAMAKTNSATVPANTVEQLSVTKASYDAIQNEELYLNAFKKINDEDERVSAPAGYVKVYYDIATGMAFKTREAFKHWFVLKDFLFPKSQITEMGNEHATAVINIYTADSDTVGDSMYAMGLYKNREANGHVAKPTTTK